MQQEHKTFHKHKHRTENKPIKNMMANQRNNLLSWEVYLQNCPVHWLYIDLSHFGSVLFVHIYPFYYDIQLYLKYSPKPWLKQCSGLNY